MINIGIIEDDLGLRQMLKRYFELTKEIKVIFDVESVDQGLGQIKLNSEVDCLLLDIGLPGKSGLEALPIFKETKPDLDIIILTSYEEESKILSALCLGACAYISKSDGLTPILEAIKLVKEGGSYMSPGIAREIVNYFINGEVKKLTLDISERQHEIIKLLISGKTYAHISQLLEISVNTVRYHIKHLYSELHATNKAEAITNYIKIQG